MHVCKNCGIELQPSDVDGYDYVCKFCDENFYDFEAVYEDDDAVTYVSFKYIDDFQDTPEVLVAIPGVLDSGSWSTIRERWEEYWHECHSSLEYPDTDEAAVADVLDELGIPYKVVEVTFSAEC